jgi:hypothetical protein
MASPLLLAAQHWRGFHGNASRLSRARLFPANEVAMTLAFRRPDLPAMQECPAIAAGTEVLTQRGACRVETLQVGDRVVTRDRGFQTLRWIGLHAQSGAIRFEAGALSAHEAITLAPQTRVLIRTALAKVLFGEAEVFARACDLVNGRSIHVLSQAAVPMVQLLFDEHEILRAAEMEVESLQPESALSRQLDAGTRAAIARMLPQATASYGPSARPCLRPAEARMFSAAE